jgi:hypothetical protein
MRAAKWVIAGSVVLAAGGGHSAQAATLATSSGAGSSGLVRVYDDIDPLHRADEFFAFDAASTVGARIALGDVDGDGVPDTIVAAGPGAGPRVRVFDGKDSSRVIADFFAVDASFTGGLNIASGDFNDDGRDDIVVNAGARVRVFSGADTSQVLLDFLPFGQQAPNGGFNVAAGEFTGDRIDDVVVAPASQFPRVTIYDGVTAAQTYVLFPLGQQGGGVSVAVGDFNGDGDDDLVAATTEGSAPRVVGVDIANGEAQLFDFAPYDANFTGGVRLAAADLDDDGRADVVTGTGGGSIARVRVFSGAAVGDVLADFLAYDGNGYTGGAFVAASPLSLPAPPAGELRFSAATYSQGESGPQATITVLRENGSSGAASVRYATQAGSATVNEDFVSASGQLDWLDGDSAPKTFNVPIVDDSADEPDETVLLTLANASGATLAAPMSATLTIVDNDVAERTRLSFSATGYTIDELGGTVTISVRREGPNTGAVSVAYATYDGDAIAGEDYVATSGTLSWADGDSADKSFTVSIVNDALDEIDERFGIRLSNPQGADLGQVGTAAVIIVDNGVGSQVAFDAASISVDETAGAVLIKVRRLNDARAPASARVRTVAGSATPGADYTSVETVLSWAAGDAETKSFSVPILDDALYETAETFTATLEALDGVTLASPSTTTLTINADQVSTITFTAAEFRMTEADGTVDVQLRRSGSTRTRVQVDYRSISGSADAAEPGLDYTAVSGTLVWEPGETDKTIAIAILDDRVFEANEMFSVLLENASAGATVPQQTRGRVVIVDDDTTPFGQLHYGGALDALLLLPLVCIALWRRRRAFAGLGLMLAASVASASPYYAGARVGSIDSVLDSRGLNEHLQQAGYTATADLDDRDVNWGFYGGWRFSDHAAIELGYLDLGDFEAELSGDLSDGQGIVDAAARASAGSGQALTLSLRLDLPLFSIVSLRPAFGLMGWQTDTRLNTAQGRYEADADGFGALVGAALDFRLFAGLVAGIGVDVLRPGNEGAHREVYAHLEWRFGD